MSSGFSFGGFGQSPAVQNTAARPGGFSFGTPTASALPSSLTGTVQTGFPLGGGLTGTVTTTATLTLGTPSSTQSRSVTFGTTPQVGQQLGGLMGVATPQLGGFGTAAATPQLGGFGTAAATPQLGGFGTGVAATPQLGGFGTGAVATPQLGGFGTAAATPQLTSQVGGFGTGTAAVTPQLTSQVGGFGTGTAAVTPQLGSFGTGIAAATPQLGLGGFGTSTAAAPVLGGLGAAPSTGLAPGLTQITSTATPVLSTGLTFGLQKTTGGAGGTTGSTLSGLLAQPLTAKPAATFSLGQPNATLGGGLGAGMSGFGVTKPLAAPVTQKRGLGGTDPKTTQPGSIGTGSVKSGDSKTLKETPVLNEICVTVEDFKKYVKNQKCVREQIARMSSKAMFRVAEDVASLKQLLCLVSSALQRNAGAIEKLKIESAQELKYAEIAQRTKDTPPGLQYENTAPTEYFERLVGEFETRMVMCRQQIEEMESHLATMHQSVMLTPQELAQLLHKLQESFVALAAQLQVIHEDIKSQKEHFLNYRKVFHDDSANVFEKRKKAAERSRKQVAPSVTVGPSPFTGMSNAAAVAMAAALNRTPQPAAPVGLGLNTGAVGATLGAPSLFSTPGAAFGATAATPFGFGGTNTATVRPLGSTTTGLFGTTPQTGGFLLANPLSAPAPSFGSTTGAPLVAGFGATPTPFGVAAQPGNNFTLQKPPAGNKRGKKA